MGGQELFEQAELLAQRPYTEISFRDQTTEDGIMFVALNPALEGCMAQGETLQEARDNLRLFRVDYIYHLLQHELPVPDPQVANQSGQIFQIDFHTLDEGRDVESGNIDLQVTLEPAPIPSH